MRNAIIGTAMLTLFMAVVTLLIAAGGTEGQAQTTETPWHSIENWTRCRETGQGYEGANGVTYNCATFDDVLSGKQRPYWEPQP